jgi:hypothetical protein
MSERRMGQQALDYRRKYRGDRESRGVFFIVAHRS